MQPARIKIKAQQIADARHQLQHQDEDAVTTPVKPTAEVITPPVSPSKIRELVSSLGTAMSKRVGVGPKARGLGRYKSDIALQAKALPDTQLLLRHLATLVKESEASELVDALFGAHWDSMASAIALCTVVLCAADSLLELLLVPIQESVTALPMIAALAEEHLPVADIAVECSLILVTRRPQIHFRIQALSLAPALLALRARPARTRMQAMLLVELCTHGGFVGSEAVSYCAHFCEHHELQPPVMALRALGALAEVNALGGAAALEAAVHLVLRVTQIELSIEAKVALAALLDTLSHSRRAVVLFCDAECSPVVVEALLGLLEEIAAEWRATPLGEEEQPVSASQKAPATGLHEGLERADRLCGSGADLVVRSAMRALSNFLPRMADMLCTNKAVLTRLAAAVMDTQRHTDTQLALLRLRCASALITCGRLGTHILMQHDLARVVVRTLRLSHDHELVWQSICTLHAIALAGERSTLLQCSALAVLIPRMSCTQEREHQGEEANNGQFDSVAIRVAAADAFTVLLQSAAVKKALFNSDLLKQVLCSATDMLEAHHNRLVSAALQLLNEIVDSHLASDFLAEHAVCDKLFELTKSNRVVVAAEAAVTLCSLLKAFRAACTVEVWEDSLSGLSLLSLLHSVVTSELGTAEAILVLVAELLKKDQMTSKLCDGTPSVQQLLNRVCDAASGLSEVGRVAAGNIVARVCEHSAESHCELAAGGKVLQLLLLSAQAAEEDQLAVMAVMTSIVQQPDDHVVTVLCKTGVLDLLTHLIRSTFKAVEIPAVAVLASFCTIGECVDFVAACGGVLLLIEALNSEHTESCQAATAALASLSSTGGHACKNQVIHAAIDFCLQDHVEALDSVALAGSLLQSVAAEDSNKVLLVHAGAIDAVLVLASSCVAGAQRYAMAVSEQLARCFQVQPRLSESPALVHFWVRLAADGAFGIDLRQVAGRTLALCASNVNSGVGIDLATTCWQNDSVGARFRSMFGSNDLALPKLAAPTSKATSLHAGLAALSLSLWTHTLTFEQIQRTVAEIQQLVGTADVEMMDKLGLLYQMIALVSRSSQLVVRRCALSCVVQLTKMEHFDKQLVADERLGTQISELVAD